MDTADRVRHILSTRSLTLYGVSQQSAEMSGRDSPYYIPHNFYSHTRAASILPNIYQLVTFSRISNYRLSDWLAVFGFRLDEIPRLGVLLGGQRTRLLDSSVYDENAWIPWFRERRSVPSIPAVAPLRQILEWGPPKRAKELMSLSSAKFLYAKMGRADALAIPDLVPGSIVRVDTRRAAELPSEGAGSKSKQLFLVSHNFHISCCRLQRLSRDRIMLCSTEFPFAQVERTLGRDVRIHGVADAEIRPLPGHSWSRLPLLMERRRKRQTLRSSEPRAGLQQLIRSSRIRAELSFREASRTSRWISETLGDQTYFAATGTLSDYETLSAPPRHVQKIISLCILYSIGFWDFLRAAGLPAEPVAREPIPDELVPRAVVRPNPRSYDASTAASSGTEAGGFLESLIERWEEIPLFLASALPGISGLKGFSLSDVFWVGGKTGPIHPFLTKATFAIVNRRIKRPVQSVAKTLSDQPLYVLLTREGTYLCGCCILEQGLIVVYTNPDRPFSPQRLRKGIDAEIIGQIAAIVRCLA